MKKLLKPKIIVYLMMVIYFIYFTFLSFAQHDGLKTQLNDIGNYNQALFTTLHGKLLLNTNFAAAPEVTSISFLGKHFNLFLFLILPFYYLFPSPKTLLVIQTLMVSLGALPLFWLGREIFKKRKWLSLVIPFSYLFNPMVHEANLYDFNDLSLAMPLIIYSFYFLYEKRYRLFYLFAAMTAFVKEDMPLIILMMGLYIFFVKKQRLRGITITLVSLTYFLLVVRILMPYFSSDVGLVFVAKRYSYLGNNLFDILKNALLNPWIVISNVFTFSNFNYLILLLFPVFFLPFFAPLIFLLSLPSLLINMLSLSSSMRHPYQFYYPAPILPLIFFSTLFALSKILQGKVKLFSKNWAVEALLSATIISSFCLGPAPYSFFSSWKEFRVSEHARNIREIKKLIPSDAKLTVQNNLGPHFSQRFQITGFPAIRDDTEYILLDINDPYSVIRYIPRERNFPFITRLFLDDYRASIIQIFESSDYGVYYYSRDGYLIFKRNETKSKNADALHMFDERMKALEERYKDYSELY